MEICVVCGRHIGENNDHVCSKCRNSIECLPFLDMESKVNETLRREEEGGQVVLTKDEYEYLCACETDYQEAKQEVAREMSAEMEHEIAEALKSNYKRLPEFEEADALYYRVKGKIDALRGMQGFIEELKKKYIGE